ncbi:glycosyltransferase involved in cell wall biosynthesis [Curtobacterium sp. PhB137]|uniref:glycosyltransferase n=1 Tax=Curtobacterium sp. PhB137 TaxID=2485182 RepID=UPI000FB508CC|nr:glycosyltransferase [Curtobacterium sp. PhB137]RPE85142.1 glycosyltransferase involved in cell wall biosynthesis [Curtobacterium sp. PhB137]
MTTRNLPLVAMLTHSAALSGAELLVARVAAARVETEVIVVLGEHGPLESLLSGLGVEHEVVALDPSVTEHAADAGGGLLAKGVSTLRSTRALARRLRDVGADVVVTHSAKAHVYGGLAGRLARIPVVAYVHDVVGAAGASRANTLVLRAALTTLPAARIANSRTTARSLGRSGPAPAVIGCPVDLPDQAAPSAPGPFTIGMVGRLTRWKGQDIAVRAFAAARALGLDPDARLRLIGAAHFGTDDHHAAELHTLVTELDLTALVEFRGHRQDVDAEISACDLLVHASRRPEPFGQVVTEAMALGRPVIAADAGGPAEVLTHGEDGLLVRPGDVDALAHAILRLAGDEQERNRLARNGRHSAARYATPHIVAQIERVLLSAAR